MAHIPFSSTAAGDEVEGEEDARQTFGVVTESKEGIATTEAW